MNVVNFTLSIIFLKTGQYGLMLPWALLNGFNTLVWIDICYFLLFEMLYTRKA